MSLVVRIGIVALAIGGVFSAIVLMVRRAERPIAVVCPSGEYPIRATVNRTDPVYICVRGTLAVGGR